MLLKQDDLSSAHLLTLCLLLSSELCISIDNLQTASRMGMIGPMTFKTIG